MEPSYFRKIFLYALIVSVGLSVLVGILVVLVGTADQSSRILLTLLSITGASFSMFLNAVFFEKLQIKILPVLGFAFTPICALLSIVSIWGETGYKPFATAFTLLSVTFFLMPSALYFERKGARVMPVIGLLSTLIFTTLIISDIWKLAPESEFGRKLFYISSTAAWTCFYLSLMLLFNVTKKFRWSLIAVQVVGWALALDICLRIATTTIGDPPSELFNRSVIILAILITALTVLIPVFHFLSRSSLSTGEWDVNKIDDEIARLKVRIEELEQQKQDLGNSTSLIS